LILQVSAALIGGSQTVSRIPERPDLAVNWGETVASRGASLALFRNEFQTKWPMTGLRVLTAGPLC
jgi:hypothetical protein